MGTKLVRDGIGEVPWVDEDAKRHLRRVKDSDEHIVKLIEKLLEEVGELVAAVEADDAIKELGDVYDVLDAMVVVMEAGLEVASARKEKLDRMGGFTKGVVWDSTSTFGE